MFLPTEAQKTFSYYLKQLNSLLLKVEQETTQPDDEPRLSPEECLNQRLVKDVLPFGAQINVCVSFAIRFFVNVYNVDLHETRYDFSSVKALSSYIRSVLKNLEELKVDELHCDREVIKMSAGEKENALTNGNYYYQIVIPNFFFHFSVPYSIARANGIPLNKGDFDGLHYYKPGFSFE